MATSAPAVFYCRCGGAPSQKATAQVRSNTSREFSCWNWREWANFVVSAAIPRLRCNALLRQHHLRVAGLIPAVGTSLRLMIVRQAFKRIFASNTARRGSCPLEGRTVP